jgi:hypothetical protein
MHHGVVVIAVAQVGPFILILVHNAGAFVEARLAVGQGALCARRFAQEGAGEETVLHHAGRLLPEATDASAGQFELRGHARLHAFLAFTQALVATCRGDTLHEFRVLADVVQIHIRAISQGLGFHVAHPRSEQENSQRDQAAEKLSGK